MTKMKTSPKEKKKILSEATILLKILRTICHPKVLHFKARHFLISIISKA
jgi:hypothetical protein